MVGGTDEMTIRTGSEVLRFRDAFFECPRCKLLGVDSLGYVDMFEHAARYAPPKCPTHTSEHMFIEVAKGVARWVCPSEGCGFTEPYDPRRDGAR